MADVPKPTSDKAHHTEISALWSGLGVYSLTAGLAFVLYLLTAAPGITWAHHGADGGELIAAAMVNGVPHPPGYPIYTVLLRGWLGMTGFILPDSELAWRGNVFSALLAGISVGVTSLTALALFANTPHRRLLAVVVGMSWAVSPLMWSQAVITEVYALHALVLSFLGWAVLVHPHRPWLLFPMTMFGVGNHLTYFLLLPAALYLSGCHAATASGRWWRPLVMVAGGTVAGLLLYLRIPVVAGADPTPPVNWGFADNLHGLWWLMSGQAYRAYLFGVPSDQLFGRVAMWANTVVMQLTPLGLGLGLLGLAYWDQKEPRRRNFALLWILPVSLYSIVYYTRDSEIYLLPVCWLLAILCGVGLSVGSAWLAQRRKQSDSRVNAWVGSLALAGVVVLLVWRYPTVSLHKDDQARQFLDTAVQQLAEASIVVSGRDFETFALWYGAWGSGDLLDQAPDTVLVNYALYQFEWYRRLLAALYPQVEGVDESIDALLAANVGERQIFFTEELDFIPESRLTPVGPLWLYLPDVQ